jgi:uncharacterized membrane protein
VNARDWLLLALRLAHALAAAVWLGGGVYFLLILRPALRERGDEARSLVGDAQRAFGEWSQVATLTMIATGAVLTFDRLSSGRGGLTYAALLAAKIVAALAAFWLIGLRTTRRRRTARRSAPELVLTLGLVAFVLGVALSSVYGPGN